MAGKGKSGPASGQRFGGRKKGPPNKISGDIRAMILAALDEVGGQAYLVEQANKNPVAFMTLLGKVLPMQADIPVKRTIRDYSNEELLAIIAAGDPANDEARTSKLH